MAQENFTGGALEAADDLVLVGKLGAPVGVQGALRFLSYTDPVEQFLTYPCFLSEDKGVHTSLCVKNAKKHFNQWLVRIAGVSDRTQAAGYTGKAVYTLAEHLAELEPGQYYWRELIGMRVTNLQGEALGCVAELIQTGANDVLVLTGLQRRLIPYIASVVLTVERDKQHILVDWDRDF